MQTIQEVIKQYGVWNGANERAYVRSQQHALAPACTKVAKAPVRLARPGRGGGLSRRIASALQQGDWFTVEDIVAVTGARKASVASSVSNLVKQCKVTTRYERHLVGGRTSKRQGYRWIRT